MQNTPTIKILFIDDEIDLCLLIQMSLKKMHIQCDTAHSIAQAKEKLKKYRYDLCISDLNLPDGHGIELVRYVSQHFNHIPIAVLTAYGSMDIAIHSLKAGAFDFLNKPIDTQALYQLIKQSVKSHKEIGRSTIQMIGQSQTMQTLRETLEKIARTQAPVFITGESGTGKDIAARFIHEKSHRKSGPFVVINCGAIPSELMESELFGHTKGSFTGATQQKAGLIVAADGGTLFLDEIAELSMPMQVKLLRALQEKKIRPIGSDQEIAVDFRVISATHQRLEQRIAQGLFRQDLYFRLHVMDVFLPPLRDRGEDILQLAEYFITQICEEWNITQKTLAPSAIDWLYQHPYQGNIRELRNILEKAITLCDEQVIEYNHLPCVPSINSVPTPPQTQHFPHTQTHQKTAPQPDVMAQQGLEAYLESIEKEILVDTLNQTYWNKTLAAKKLKMSFRSLRYRLKKFGLDHQNNE